MSSTTTPARRIRRAARRARASVRDAAARLGLGPSSAELELRRRLRADGASLRPARPAPLWRDWVGTALRTPGQVETAVVELGRCGLPIHGDRPKNWDLLVALGTILERTTPAAAVLDMGAPQYSRLLPWLYLYGYRRLTGIDLVYDDPVRLDPIEYLPMDLTATTFADDSFDAIACLSVIEHGVDLAAFARETARLLRPGGLLVVSTDYWSEPVDTRGQLAYGVPIRILGPGDLEALAGHAAEHGLSMVRSFDPTCEARVVHWARFDLDYTFAVLVFERTR